MPFERINIDQAKQLIGEENAQVIDIRDPASYESGHIEGAVHIDNSNVQTFIDEADKALLDRFGVFGPPTIIFFDADGQQRHGYEVVGYMKAEDFAAHLDKAFASSIRAQITP